MTELLTPGQQVLGNVISMKITSLVREVTYIGQTLGTEVTVQQLLAGLVAETWDRGASEMTREEFTQVYDFVALIQDKLRAVDGLPGGSDDYEPDFGAGPEATADAVTPEEAGQLANHWSGPIELAAFDLDDDFDDFDDFEADSFWDEDNE